MLPFIDPPRRSLDPDARAFAAASGATDIAALSAFVRGVKSLGLWNNMVCWPLRSSQNTGSGTTAYGLGGWQGLNLTLINGPTWTVNGISKGGGTDILTGNLGASIAAPWTFVVAETASAYNGAVQSQVYSDSSSNGMMIQSPGSPQSRTIYGSSGSLTETGVSRLGVKAVYQSGRSVTGYFCKTNKGAPTVNTTGAFTFASGTFRIGEAFNARQYASVVHFAAIFNAAVNSDALVDLINTTVAP